MLYVTRFLKACNYSECFVYFDHRVVPPAEDGLWNQRSEEGGKKNKRILRHESIKSQNTIGD